MPNEDPVRGVGTPDRDRAIDVARLAALVVVMLGHCALLLATIDTAGLHIDNLLGEVPAIRPLTWVLQVMPLFFLAGGAAGAYGFRRGTPWGTWLFVRTQRLCRPLFWYLTVWVLALAVTRVVLGTHAATDLGHECVALLWFLGVYLVVLAFVPVLTRLHSGRATAGLVAALLAVVAGFDGLRMVSGDDATAAANFLFVWLIPVTLGVAYARRLLTVRAALIGAVAAFAAQLALALTETYEVSLVVTGVERFSNTAPPTLLLALHGTWMSCLFLAAAGPIRRWARRPRIWHVVAAGNSGAMTLYLWHIPAIAVATFGLHAVGSDAYDVHEPDYLAMLAVREFVFVIVMVLVFRVLSPLEHRRLPWWDHDATAGTTAIRSTVAGASVCLAGVALVLLAKNGLGEVDGWVPLGVMMLALCTARSSAVSACPPVPPNPTRRSFAAR